ncbi:Nickel-dependent hydrogenases b-type cytochrome subunit superfamily [Alloalcanivorax dieselolei B5]|uniref:Nickel-dependent hydrogenases b-type cytochrome subunit superfamily n=1 Tax=Alcanivorax dieselolei (strain DSM 16502 / CGMCC 1.3690 / MCCC 1A00001 / B-5) TaxID=930169 RepID=K0CIM9_ALCDB|nr:cytochrome b [Alloalcanivorax dieselolei]AFT72508.1 Nickel-dependent hydrogenases b-type cytochrome subunit superfamily [Alloalcanivorax dieselolei B5]GGJ78341.1 cytochrome b [Alloalcanivorax dieselolei]
MKWRNDDQRYGVVTVGLHWLVALVVFALFGLGLYMVELGYYHPWYRSAPHWHRSIGLLLLATVLVRLIWRVLSPPPKAPEQHHAWERIGAGLAHWALYLLLLVAMISGYLISTADGAPIQVFNWFSVPSLTGRRSGLEDLAGAVHYWATWAVIVLAALHALAALKHHFIDRDDTLRRIFGLAPRRPSSHR